MTQNFNQHDEMLKTAWLLMAYRAATNDCFITDYLYDPLSHLVCNMSK